MKTITFSELAKAIGARAGAFPVGILADTDAGLRKTGNPLALPVSKRVQAVGFVGADYGASVRREGARQGADTAADFVAEPLPWGEWEVPGKVISHKGRRYLRVQSTPGARRTQPARLLGYRDAGGRFVAREAVAPFLPPKRESGRQQAAGLADTVWPRTYAFDSLRRVRLGGRTFEVVPD